MDVFRADNLYKVDSMKISYFAEDWSVLETMAGAQVFLILDQPDSKTNDNSNRLTVFEYIVNAAKLLKENTNAGVFHQALYLLAPFPVTNSTNYGGVRHSSYGNLLAVQTSTYDAI